MRLNTHYTSTALRVLKKQILTLITTCLFVMSLNAQNLKLPPQYNLSQFSTEEGLSQGNVYQIIKDKDGFLWVSTEDGLNRFDGYSFKIFRNDKNDSTSISDNNIRCILEDLNGVLWFGTNQGGLCKYNKDLGNFKHFTHDESNKNSISQNTVSVIFETSDGRLWVGTHWGLNIFNKQSEKFTALHSSKTIRESLLDDRIYSIVETNNHEIWVGTKLGISIYDLDGQFIKNIYQGSNSDFPIGKAITNLLIDHDNDIWASVEGGGVFQYQIETNNFKELSNLLQPREGDLIRGLFADSQGLIWIGIDGIGVQTYDKKTEQFNFVLKNSNLYSDQLEKVYWIYQDNDQNMWFGAYGHGFFVHNTLKSNFIHHKRNNSLPNSLSYNSILAIKEDVDGEIWIGSDGGGLDKFNAQTQTVINYKYNIEDSTSLSGDVVKSLLIDSDDNLWVGTYVNGLNLKRKGQEIFEHITSYNSELTNDNIWALLEDRNQNIWIGTLGGGLNKYDPRTRKFTHYNYNFEDDSTLSGINIGCLMEDYDGNIWAGTVEKGISIYLPKEDKFLRLKNNPKDSTSLSNNEIRYLFESRDSIIWVGTTNGLNKYNKKLKSFVHYFDKDGLPSNIIKGIVQDGYNNLWLSTNNGICKFNPNTGKIDVFNQSDGLQASEFNYNSSLIATDGTIYMGGINGFNRFHPDQVKKNEHKPVVLLTKFLLFNQEVDINKNSVLPKDINRLDQLELNHKQYVFTIEFSVDEYQFPKTNLYQYKLEGFDPDWNNVGTIRQATYTNLPPGEYEFQVRATNNSGVWSDKTRKLTIIILPPWWLTWWAKSLLVLFILAAIRLTYYLRVNTLQNQRRKLQLQVTKRTKEVVRQNTEIQKQAEDLIEANKEISKRKDIYKRNHENLKKLYEIGTKITSTLSIATLEERVYECVNELLPSDIFYLGLYSHAANSIEISSSIERGKQNKAYSYHLVHDSDRLPVLCFNSGEVIITNDFLNDYPKYPQSVVGDLPNSSLMIPLLTGEKIIGIVSVASFEKNAYTDYHISILKNLAVYISIAISNAKTFDQLKEANKVISIQKDIYKTNHDNVKILSEAGSNIISTLSTETINERVYQSVNQLLSADSFYFGLYNEAINSLEFQGDIEKGKKLKAYSYNLDKDSTRLGVQCFLEKKEILTNDLEKDYPNYPSPGFGELPESVIMVPLFQRKQVMGVISVGSFFKNAYTDYHISILKNLGVYISIAIENAQTFDKLDKSYAQLKELDEYKEAMTAMIVHDFKNSLNTVISFSEGNPTKRRLKSIQQAGQFMLNMVLNILDVQKFETAEVKLALANYPISKVLNEAIGQLNYMIEQKSIQLIVDQNEGLFCRIDYELITRTIVNILSNAAKYVPANGLIEITTEKNKDSITVSIKDDGPGIPADKIHLVFDKYSQINAKKSGSVRSTGIGLTFCKMVIEAHGGTIDVDSIEGQGSNFHFTLPIILSHVDQDMAIEKENNNDHIAFELSVREKELLQPHLDELSQWEVYDYSEVTAVIEKINSDNKNVTSWRENLMKALYNGNEKLYKELLKP